MRRDRLTFAMMIGIPILQMIIFGYAINSDPRHLSTAVVAGDFGPFTRSVIAAMQNSGYFAVVETVSTEARARELVEEGGVQFVLTIPVDFERSLVRGESPSLLLTADATDPAATSNALAAFRLLCESALSRELSPTSPFLTQIHNNVGQSRPCCGHYWYRNCN